MRTYFGSIWTVVIGVFYIFIVISCIVNIVNPRYLWKKFESWKAKSEPSDAFFKARRISSIVVLIVINIFVLGPTVVYLLDK